ncbi:segregation and condensation protein A [Seleniivibrio woodruffii]|uniref:Segregation and condensation protein A n=1 Tax=Seleniivibrio woodruffii TaxID=1078050 RepID=A0A4R1KA71_9BACT|nr:segregation/condensation protein A [Seleniivibrio woodruffii]TCK60793.1 condensin subunit ScpA [Seleniivibrio woodruffii]TVZ36423.1 condensin subunit ScpA [Seleniivibrio woodruffii]
MSRLLDVRLDNFEGPLDLLIHLIYKNELNIYDIPIAFIAGQFVDAVREMEKMDIEVAAEFINMASYLIYLKSRMLLPKESLPMEELDPEEEKFILTQRLVEYSFYKDVAQQLRELEGDSGKYLMRTSSIYIERESMQTEDPYRIANAFFSVLEKETIKPMKFEKDIVDVTDIIAKIKELVFEKHKLFWTDIVKTCVSRREVVISFLAVLELMRLAVIQAMQADTFGEIVIENIAEAANG